MNETEQLRDLLQRAVPEAPDVDAGPAARAGRRGRVRRRGAAVLVTAACVAVAVAVPLSLRDDGARPAPSAPTTYADDRTEAVEPYTQAPCPTEFPERVPRQLPDLADATAVRLCLEPDRAAAGRLAAPDDALVHGLDRFAADVTALPDVDPDRCAALDYYAAPFRLVVAGEGPDRLVAAEFCDLVRVGDRAVDAEAVLAAFHDALDRQRDRFTYPPAERGAPTCRTPLTSAPFRPGRDAIESAVSCPPYDSGATATPVTGAGLDRLREAWAATPPVVETDYESPEPCTLDDDGWPFVMVRTTVGDVVRLAGTDCDRLVAVSTTDPDLHWEVPVAFDDVAR